MQNFPIFFLEAKGRKTLKKASSVEVFQAWNVIEAPR